MKHLLAFALALLCSAAFATGKHPTPAPGHTQGQTQGMAQQQMLSATFNSGGDAWAVSLPSFGAPSYAGQYSICVRGHIVFFGLDTQWGPDLDCVREIARLTQLLATPVPKPAAYPMAGTSGLSPADEATKVVTVACDPPASDKPVRTAAARQPKAEKVAAGKVGGCKL